MDTHVFVWSQNDVLVEFTATVKDAAFIYRKMLPIVDSVTDPITIGYADGPQEQSSYRTALRDFVYIVLDNNADTIDDFYCFATEEVEEDSLVINLGDNTYGIIPTRCHIGDPDLKVQLYHDHKRSGSGVNNLVLDAFGKELDLEFTSSRDLTDDEFRHWQAFRSRVKKPVRDILHIDS